MESESKKMYKELYEAFLRHNARYAQAKRQYETSKEEWMESEYGSDPKKWPPQHMRNAPAPFGLKSPYAIASSNFDHEEQNSRQTLREEEEEINARYGESGHTCRGINSALENGVMRYGPHDKKPVWSE